MMYCSNEDMYLSKSLDAIKKHPKSNSLKDDKILLDFYDITISNVTKVNSAYPLDFATAQLMVNKLSDITLRTKYIDSLVQLRDKTGDSHKVNNYLATVEQIIVKCKIEINNLLDIEEMERDNIGEYPDQAAVYPVQTQDRRRGYRGHFGQRHGEYNNNRGNRGNYYNQYKGNPRGHYNQHRGNIGKSNDPVNMDNRENLIFNFDGTPADLSMETDSASAYHTSGFDGQYQGDGGYRGGPQRGAQRGRGPRGQTPGFNWYCKVCKARGHGTLLRCPSFTEFIPRGENVKPFPRDACRICLASTGPSEQCSHKALRGYDDWLCKETNKNFLLCDKCNKHKTSQDWAKTNFDVNIGKAFLNKLWDEFDNDTAIIN